MKFLKEVSIESDSLFIKVIDESFTSDIFKEFTDEITLYMMPKPTEEEAGIRSFIQNSLKELESGTNLQLVILVKESKEFLGCLGMHQVHTDTPELGMWIKASAHGHKYGLEAIKTVIQWARENLDFKYFKYPVDKRNIASRNIAELNGGVIQKEFKCLNQKGFELDQVEYWIFK